jgi:RNA polymerase sigma factor (sigma-70 family)
VHQESFVDFYRLHHGRVRALVSRRLGRSEQVDDLTAEAFGIAWAHHRSGGDLTTAWLHQVVRNLIGAQYRRIRRHRDLQRRLLTTSEDLVEDEVGESIAETLDMHRAMRELSTADRRILHLAFWEDLPAAEIARRSGCSAEAARVRVLRAKRRLRSLL